MRKILWIVSTIIILDQALKIYIKTHFELNQDAVVFFDWFKLTYVENPGMAYGIHFGGYFGKIALSLVRIFLISIMGYYIFKWVKKNDTWHFYLPVSLILAGAIGNLIDSVFYGLMFNTGTQFEPNIGKWIGYEGISKLNFDGYSSIFGGVVVDMFNFPLIDTHLPQWIPIWGGERIRFFSYIFNIADSSITIGGLILGYVYFFKSKYMPREWFKDKQ